MPEPLAISRIRWANVQTPPWVPAPLQGSQVRNGSSTTCGDRMNSDWSQACCVDTGRIAQRLIAIGLPGRNCDGSTGGKVVREVAARPANTTDSLVAWPNRPDEIVFWFLCTLLSSSERSVANEVKKSGPGLLPSRPSRTSASELNSTWGLLTSPITRTSEPLRSGLVGGGSRTCIAVVSPSAVGLSSSSPSSSGLLAALTNGSSETDLLSPSV